MSYILDEVVVAFDDVVGYRIEINRREGEDEGTDSEKEVEEGVFAGNIVALWVALFVEAGDASSFSSFGS